MVEIYFNAQSDNGTLTASKSRQMSLPYAAPCCSGMLIDCGDHALQVWSQSYMQSVSAYKDPRAAMRLENLMRQAGFVEVEQRVLTLPLSGWSNSRWRAGQ